MKSKKLIKIILGICILAFAWVMGVNIYTVAVATDRILTAEQAAGLEDIDCILVLGAGVNGDEPKPMLRDRIDTGVELYFSGASDKLLMSGDHGRKNYDEVNVMKDCAVEAGADSSDVFMDHAGFSTYESIYRAKEIFGAHRIIIVTQRYHLFRALYIARQLGVEAYGVCSDVRSYTKPVYRELREVLARNKDFVKCIFKPEPTYLGDAIPVSGDGNQTNDK